MYIKEEEGEEENFRKRPARLLKVTNIILFNVDSKDGGVGEK